MAQLPIQRKDWALNPFAELENLQREMNRLFDFSLARAGDEDTSLLRGAWAPAIDVYDTKDALVVKADLPGLNKEDIDVSIQDNVLTIRGEKKRSEEVKEENCVRTERFYGTFHRALTLPSDVDASKIQAKFKNGVLELNIPKKEEAKPKQIKVDVT